MKLRDNLNVKMLERFIKENYSKILLNSPVNSMTPFVVEINGEEEFLFIVKAESWLYEPLKDKTIKDNVPMGVKAYMEEDKLIWGFNIDPDISLETEIYFDKIFEFLKRMYKQKKLTVVILDHITNNIVWLTNNYPFWKVKEQFNPLFKYFEII